MKRAWRWYLDRLPRTRVRRLIVHLGVVGIVSTSAVVASVATAVWFYQWRSSPASADVAVVLGAAAYGWGRPSQVFEERIRHGIRLYEEGRVRRILFTGGSEPPEAEIARAYAVEMGVPDSVIVTEPRSRSTLENVRLSCPLLRDLAARRVLIVTDPLHEFRAVMLARWVGIPAEPSPTPTSRYRSMSARGRLWLSETVHVLGMVPEMLRLEGREELC